MRVRATGSPGVTTVNAVQTTVKGEGASDEGKENQVHPKADWVEGEGMIG